MHFALQYLKNGIAFRISSDDPSTWTGYGHAPEWKKKAQNKKRNKQKTTWKTIADRLVLSEKAAEIKKGSLLPARKKTPKTKSVSTPTSMFSGAGLALACTDSRLLCGWFRNTVLCPWGLMTSSVSSVDFCRAEHDGLTWSCVRNVEIYCSHLSPSSPLTPAPQLPPPFSFNSTAKLPPTEQK